MQPVATHLQQLVYNDGNGGVFHVIRAEELRILKITGATQLVVSCSLRVELRTGGCEDRTWGREAEESPMLEAVARERLMKT
jgi:hypothetical protein